MPSLGCLERPLSRFFHSYGIVVCNHPWPFLFLPLLLSSALSTGLMHLSALSDAIYLFTPTDAPSKMERMAIHEKWPVSDGSFIPGRTLTQSREAQISVVSRDGGNILLPEYAQAIYRLDKFIQSRIQVRLKGQNYSFGDLCLRGPDWKCSANDHVHVISQLYNHGINITYPNFRLGMRGGYIGGALGEVSLSRGGNNETILASARAWLLLYNLRFYPSNISYISGQWEQEFKRAMDDYPPDPFISITYFHSQTLPDELKRNADSLIPRFVCAFTLLVLFSVACSIVTVESTYYIDWVLSKPLLSLLGVFNAGMAIASAVGLCVYINVPYNDIVAVMPFLVVAVGTDNMFLMVAAVRRTSRSLPAASRMGECMAEAAVSILITALTDAFSFAVGTITTIPAVKIFCIYTCIALLLTFLYQMTFFCALLSISTRHEEEGRHSVLFRHTLPESLHSSSSLTSRLLWMGSRPHPAKENQTNFRDVAGAQFFRQWYAPLLVQPAVRALVLVWYVVYVCLAVLGCSHLREGLEPVNLLVDDSYAVPHYRVLETFFWQYGAPLQIVVNNAPDLGLREERERVASMVHDMATTIHSIGDDGVEFWLRDMELFYKSRLNISISDKAFYLMAQHFILSSQHLPWPNDVVWEMKQDGSYFISSFRFLIGMRELSSTTSQQEACEMFRAVAAGYPSLNVTTFMPLWLFTDQYALVVPNTVQDIVIAVSCMLIIAFLLIPEPSCCLWVAFTIGSIDLGVLGFMTLWGVNLDAISMITIIMSVGFSVDYSAHIAYGYVVSKAKDPKERIQEALGDLGWPVIQGGMSTILAVVVLADVPAYMIMTFFKTVFLAISIGLLHGLLFLPLMLTVFVGRGRSSKVASSGGSLPSASLAISLRTPHSHPPPLPSLAISLPAPLSRPPPLPSLPPPPLPSSRRFPPPTTSPPPLPLRPIPPQRTVVAY